MKNASKIIKSIIGAVLIFAIVFSCASKLNKELLKTDYSSEKLSEFWEDPGKFDVWNVGSSHTYCDVFPMELWGRSGITSYDVAAPTAHIAQSYWVIKCALERAKPELIILDVYEFHLDKKLVNEPIKVHYCFDAIPFSLTKLRAMYDLTDGDLRETFKYAFPFSQSHNKWKSIEREDIEDAVFTQTKGARFRSGIEDMSEGELLGPEETLPEENLSMVYLRKIADLCEKEGVPLLLTALPYYGLEDNQRGLNSAVAMAGEIGVPMLDMRNGLVDPFYDFGDINHLTFSGGQKVTKYLADYLDENYDLTDHRNEDNDTRAEWDKAYDKYVKTISRKINNSRELYRHLTWLKGDHFATYIYEAEQSDDKLLESLIANLDHNTMITADQAEEMTGKRPDKGITIIAGDLGTGDIVNIKTFVDGVRVKED